MGYYINESMVAAPSGAIKANASYNLSGGYLQLTPNSLSQFGQLEYTIVFPANFVIQADFYANGGADANWIYWGCSSTAVDEDNIFGGYTVTLDEYAGDPFDVAGVLLKFGSTRLAQVAIANLGNGTVRTLKVIVTGTRIQVYVAGVLKIDYTDIARTLGGNLCGIAARTGGVTAEHRCYNFKAYDTFPTVTTSAASAITSTKATIGATLNEDAGLTVTERGIQFATTPNPDKQATELGSFSVGTYSENLTQLTQAQVYYFRAYAVNSAGTGYGAWMNFTTLPSAYMVKINGVDRTKDIQSRTITMEDALNDKQDTCRFIMYDRLGLGFPANQQEITIDLDNGTRIFGGIITRINKLSKHQYGNVAAQINCIDYVNLFDSNLVHKTYINMTDLAIIQDIVATYCDGLGFTTNNVVAGVTVNQISFNYVQPSQALRKLTDLTGRNWYIDYNKDIHYFAAGQTSSPINLTDSSTNYYDLEIDTDSNQLKNRVYVRGGTNLSDPTIYSVKGDGVAVKFVIPDKPHNITIKVNGVSKSVGILNIDTSGFDWYLNYDEKYLQQDSGGVILTTSDTLSVTYQYDIPILVAVENSASIASTGGIAKEFAIFDSTISTTQAARDRASAELTDYANSLIEGQFTTLVTGFFSGQQININLTEYGINSNYVVQKVDTNSLGGGVFEYTIYIASSKTMGIIRFLIEMLEQQNNNIAIATNEIVDNLLTANDSILSDSITESLIIDSSAGYATWCPDSISLSPTTRARWDLFQWG